MYEEYWRLHEKPFQNNLDRRYFFFSPTHSEALIRLLYSVNEERGATLLTGAFGSGKSMVCSQAAHELEKQGYDVAFVNVPSVPADEFIKVVVYALGGSPSTHSKADLLHALSEYARMASEGSAGIVLFVDDAHSIRDKGTFEELALLMNLRDEKRELMRFVITGEPEVTGMVNAVPFVRRAIEIRYHLISFGEEETAQYIRHRLSIAGAKGEIFGEDSIAEVFRWSKGIPRNVNSICDLALFMGQAGGAPAITREVVREAAQSLSSRPVFQLEG